MTSKPHDGVYTRLAPSKVHGIGVFALLPIPAGTRLFEPDDDELVRVPLSDVDDLPDPIKKLYDDFCPKEDGWYKCLKNLNRMPQAWYLNHSNNPNVAADKNLKFYALKAIDAGEELTSNYSTYTEVSEREFLLE